MRLLQTGAVLALMAGLTAFVSAQVAKPATMDDLLNEVKGLRADMARSSSAMVQAQMIVARLQVEEQRINGLSKQLLDVRALTAPLAERTKSVEWTLAHFVDDLQTADPELRKQMELQRPEFDRELETLRHRQQELKARETELTQQYDAEQGRWNDFNSRLDALERSLPVR